MLAIGLDDEDVCWRALKLLERLARPIGGLPDAMPHQASTRAERVVSDEAHVAALRAMAESGKASRALPGSAETILGR